MVFPTPQGYRGEGVFDNFWKLIERWKVTFMITVPTAIAALMQRPVECRYLVAEDWRSRARRRCRWSCYKRFEKAAGVTICEGYGLTEATCLVSCNPLDGEKKVGSVGVPFPYTDVKIVSRQRRHGGRGCGTDEIGEICVSNPGVYAGRHLYRGRQEQRTSITATTYLRTGDLGRIDADGYLWITGRAKDLIIRGGHNIDPAEIEEALAGHEAVAFAGAIGQPDAFAGELPCAYVELVDGASVTEEELMDFAAGAYPRTRRASRSIWKSWTNCPRPPSARCSSPTCASVAITRVYNAALAKAGSRRRGRSRWSRTRSAGWWRKVKRGPNCDDEAVTKVLGEFARPWDWT